MKSYKNYNSNLKSRAKDLRKNMTFCEKKIWYDFLRNLEPKCIRQRPVGNYILDFYIPKIMLAIEIDGDSHFDSDKSKIYDEHRSKDLKNLGVQVIRFTNNEIIESFDSCCEKITEVVNSYPSVTS
jgi:very-short-patch-repair endonuclease